MHKILIVGSGPAGLSSAFFLLDRGYEITVFERLGDSQYARYHEICGGGISKKAFRELSPMRPAGIVNDVDRTRIIWPDGTEVKIRTEGYIIDRPTFLSSLREQCSERGVVFVNRAVKDICARDNGYTIISTDGDVSEFDCVIGADGCCSTVRKKLFGNEPMMKVPATEFIVDRAPDNDLVIRLASDGSGTYTWEFPRGKMSGTGGMKGRYDEKSYIMKGSRFIPIGGVGKIVNKNAYLVGDAAAMANPISYGGLKAALLSGKKAAEAIVKNDPQSYQRWWDSSILSDKRFMEFNRTLRSWSAEDMNKAVKPFRHGGIYLPGLYACITQPKNVNMYFGCLFAFKFGW